jgi:hypothetical protein
VEAIGQDEPMLANGTIDEWDSSTLLEPMWET